MSLAFVELWPPVQSLLGCLHEHGECQKHAALYETDSSCYGERNRATAQTGHHWFERKHALI
jgi:hypothetical protein